MEINTDGIGGIAMTQFYGLFPEDLVLFGKKWAYIEDAKIINTGEPELCPVCGKPVSMLDWLPPHEIMLSTVKLQKLGDFLWGSIFPFLISDKVKQLIAENDIKGIKVHNKPVTIANHDYQQNKVFPKTYYKVKVEWNGANRDDRLSGASYSRDVCPYCRSGSIGEKMTSIVLDELSWNGLDVFEARGIPGLVIVTDRFNDLLAKHKILNYRAVPIQDISYDETQMNLWII